MLLVNQQRFDELFAAAKIGVNIEIKASSLLLIDMMKQFKITYQNPFEQDAKNIVFYNQEETINSYLAIDWTRLNLESFEREGEVLHNFYFFDIAVVEDHVTTSNLTIAGQYTSGEQLAQMGPLFDVIYERQQEKKTHGFLGLGAESTKMVFSTTHLPDSEQNFVTKCISAFLNDDLEFLENEINYDMNHTFRRD